jgi:hypothetical protein
MAAITSTGTRAGSGRRGGRARRQAARFPAVPACAALAALAAVLMAALLVITLPHGGAPRPVGPPAGSRVQPSPAAGPYGS